VTNDDLLRLVLCAMCAVIVLLLIASGRIG
jgi:hypothetical protein